MMIQDSDEEKMADEIAELKQQRDDLLAVLKLANTNSRDPADEPWRVVARAAIAKVKP